MFSILLVFQYGWFCAIPTYEIIGWILPPTLRNDCRQRSKTDSTTAQVTNLLPHHQLINVLPAWANFLWHAHKMACCLNHVPPANTHWRALRRLCRNSFRHASDTVRKHISAHCWRVTQNSARLCAAQDFVHEFACVNKARAQTSTQNREQCPNVNCLSHTQW